MERKKFAGQILRRDEAAVGRRVGGGMEGGGEGWEPVCRGKLNKLV